MEGTLTYAIGKGVAKFLVPALAAQRVLGGAEIARTAKGYPRSPQSRYLSPHDMKSVEHVTDLKPKYHKLAQPGKAFSSTTYQPKQLSVRTEYDGENAHTFNNLGGSENSVAVYSDNKALYDRLVSGESMPSQWGGQGDLHPCNGFLKKTRKQPVSAGRLLAGLQMSDADMAFYQNVYKIPDDKVGMLGSKRFLGMMRDEHPVGHVAEILGSVLTGSYKMTANSNVTIRPLAAKKKDNGEEHRAEDDGWVISFDSTSKSPYKIANPVRGINTPEDTLSEHFHIVNNWKVTKHMGESNTSTSRFIRSVYHSMQAAILEAESMGFNWYAESDRSNAYPISRHPLYANNFPYRGCTKKRLGEKGAKRQKGGDAPRVVEWDPSIVNHFEGKTKEDVFFA